MGTCCVGSSCEPSDQLDCDTIRGDYSPDNTTSKGCAFLTALSDYLHNRCAADPIILLAAGGTFSAIYDLRDVILSKSPLGKRILVYYQQYASKGVEILMKEPKLLGETLRVFLIGASFGRAILQAYDGRSEATLKDRTFTKEAYERGLALIKQFRTLVADASFDEPLAFLEQEISRFIGASPGQALDILEVKPRRKSSTRRVRA